MMGKCDAPVLSGQATGPDPIQEIAIEISSTLKSKDLTVRQALLTLDRTRDLLLESTVI